MQAASIITIQEETFMEIVEAHLFQEPIHLVLLGTLQFMSLQRDAFTIYYLI